MRREVFAAIFAHDRFVIGPVADVYLRNGVAFEDDEVGADAVEAPAVMSQNVVRGGLI